MKKLQEADFGTFGADAAGAIDSITKHASAAFGKFKASRQQLIDKDTEAQKKAEAEVEKARNKAEAEAEKAKAKADKDALAGNALSGQQLSLRIPRIVAQLCVGTADLSNPESLKALKNLKTNQFQIVFTSINKARKHLAHYPSEMRKRLMTGSFIKSESQNQRTMNLVLGKPADEDELTKAKAVLAANQFKEQEAWADVLALGDQTSMGHMVDLMKQIGAQNAKANETAAKADRRPESLGVVKLFTAQRHAILARLDALNRAVEKMSGDRAEPETPVTEALKRRLRRFVAEQKCNG